MGVGASSHCDIVVAVDVPGERILAIGGNVLRSVSLKVLPGARDPQGGLRARTTAGVPLFAHLRLRADPIAANALAESPVLAAFACPGSAQTSARATQVLAQIRMDGPWSAVRRSPGPGGAEWQEAQQNGETPAPTGC